MGKKQLNSNLIYFLMVVVLMFQTILSPVAIVAETSIDEEQSLNVENSSTNSEASVSSVDVTESKSKQGLSKDDPKSEMSDSKTSGDLSKSSSSEPTGSTNDSSSKKAKDVKSDEEVSKDEPDESKSSKEESEKVKTDLRKEYKVWDNSNMDKLKLSDSDRLDINQDGLPFLNGDVFLVGGDGVDTSRFDKLMDRGIEEVIQTGDVSLGEKFSMFFDKTFKPMTVSASSAPYIRRVGSATYKYSTVGIYEVNGELAYCIEHHRPPAMTGLPYDPLEVYHNIKVQRALYYGWGGDGSIFSSSQKEQGIVITSLILSRIYNPGDSYTGDNYPKYDELWNKVQNGSVPNRNIVFSDHTLSISVKGGKQVSQTATLKTGSDNSTKIKVPSKVTIVNESTGKKVTGGVITIKGGQKFHLEAPLSYNSSYSSGNVKGTAKSLLPMLTKSKSGATQDLVKGTWAIDPNLTDSFKVPFERQEVTLTKKYIDEYTGNTMGTDKKKLTIGDHYKQCAPNDYDYKGRDMYKKTGCKTGTVPDHDFTLKYYYNSEHKITVNYYDNRNNDKIKDSKSYMKEAGSSYSESHPTIKSGDYTYRFVKHTGDPAKGKIGTSNLIINYYYDLPLAEVGLKKLQVYTAPADEGLPVVVNLYKNNIYDPKVPDMNDKNRRITIALYQGDKKIGSKRYTANDLPTKIDFEVPTNVLEVDQKKEYTV
ncbi:thioester domain-containing protein, partial [Paraliobacillus ryukyuensis]|uniref:thioester domain-containing protein n=1 Tax=Paraliobacillus ryukyuensis TaxID=200904 RepID=UPI00351D738C